MRDYAFEPLLQSIKNNHCTQVLVPGVGENVAVQGKEVKPLATWEGHTDEVTAAVTVLPDGTVVSGSWDNTLRHWPRVGPTLTETQFNEVLSALVTNTSVHTLSVNDGFFLNTMSKSLFHVLKTHPTLNTLVLDNCGMGYNTVAKLLLSIEEGVKNHHTLPKRVSFEGNPGLVFFKNQYSLAQAYFIGVAS